MNRTVHKFGGKAVAAQEDMLNVSEAEMSAQPGEGAMMVSAYVGDTAKLLTAFDNLVGREKVTPKIIKEVLEDFESGVIAKFENIEGEEHQAKAKELFDKDLRRVRGAINNAAKSEQGLNNSGLGVRDLIISLGESSGRQGTAALLNANGISAFDIGPVTSVEGSGRVHRRIQGGFDDTLSRLDTETANQILVGGGWVGGMNGGILTELSRSYTDTSAVDFQVSLRNAGQGSGNVVFWKPEEGMMTADPRLLLESQKPLMLDDISLYEALEVARMGSSLLHVGALELAMREKINLTLKGVATPELSGTNYSVSEVPTKMPFKTIATHPHDTLYLDISEVAGESGVTQYLGRVFGEAGIAVNDIITEGNTISYTVPLPPDETDIQALRKKIRGIQSALSSIEINGTRRNITAEWDQGNMSNVSVVGSELAHQEGIMAGLSTALGSVGINIDQLAHTKKQNRISFYVPHADSQRAVQVIHKAYFDKAEAYNKLMLKFRAKAAELLAA